MMREIRWYADEEQYQGDYPSWDTKFNIDQSEFGPGKSTTDLSKKTHLQVVSWLMAPPMRGPIRLPTADDAAS